MSRKSVLRRLYWRNGTERVLEHNGGDTKSHLVNHAIEKCHKYPKIEDFNIIDKVLETTPLNGKLPSPC